jgi:hypothetical protein
MSYEVLEARRAARAAKEQSITTMEGKRGRKRKGPEEADSVSCAAAQIRVEYVALTFILAIGTKTLASFLVDEISIDNEVCSSR